MQPCLTGLRKATRLGQLPVRLPTSYSWSQLLLTFLPSLIIILACVDYPIALRARHGGLAEDGRVLAAGDAMDRPELGGARTSVSTRAVLRFVDDATHKPLVFD